MQYKVTTQDGMKYEFDADHREQGGDLMVFYEDGVEQFSVQADEIKTIATANVKQSAEVDGFA